MQQFANVAKPSLSAQNSSARRPQSLVEKLVKVTAGGARALEQNKAASVAPRPKPSTVSKPAKRELNGLRLCVGCAYSKT